MKWQFKEKNIEELEVTLAKATYDDEVAAMVGYLEKFGVQTRDILPIKTPDRIKLVKQTDIIAIEVDGPQLVIETLEGRLLTTDRLYRFKERLSSEDMIQVSKQSIINIQHLMSLEASFSGNMLALMTKKLKVNVSRRYLKDLEKRLGLR